MRHQLNRAGQIVHTFRSTKVINGKETFLTRAEVGKKGQVFHDLPEHQVALIRSSIDAGHEDWEVLDDQEPEEAGDDTVEGDTGPPSGDPDIATDGDAGAAEAEGSAADAEAGGGDASSGESAGGGDSERHGHDADDDHEHPTNYADMDALTLDQLVDLHALTVQGTGANSNVLKKDNVAALLAEHGKA